MTVAIANMTRMFARGSLLSGLAAYSASEAVTKVSRLVAVIALARVLTPAQVGVVAGALAISELLKAFTENGVIQKIISASADDLEATCHTARRINWAWSGGLFALQVSIAAAFHLATGQVAGPLLIALMAGEYLLMPAGLVQCGLAMREGKLAGTATVAGAQNVAANLMTAAMVLIWPSPLAVAAARLASAPIWLSGMRRLRPWAPKAGVIPAPIRPFARFGAAILGIEFLKVLRMQADKLIIGVLMGPEALGIYFFAFNAGLGIANSFSVAFSTVLFPHLCGAANRVATLRNALAVALVALFPIIAVQALAAPIYVPIIFGEKWASVAPLVSILCFAALPAIVWSAAAQWLRSAGRPDVELVCSVFIAAFVTLGIVVAAPFGLSSVVWSVLVTSVFSQLVASVAVLFIHVLPQRIRIER
ncbi:oligosaccharide flippase family protein [Oricola sp.]|uniref:oligosaccharide flippase family protein n=1 Tax=Oricola sp. TaxID=1979950 RepID=UPI0025E351DE|nr:oligosaccharide flippase family protein [Oricola sp.]MCI5078611.1 oligosaccharide flippase family protein [Oricola sp.]